MIRSVFVQTSRLWGALVTFAVVLLLHQSGLTTPERSRFDQAARQALAAGELHLGNLGRLTPGLLVQALRRHFTDEDDMNRYRAYARALRGQSYSSYYVRPIAVWRSTFERAVEEPEPEAFPLITPEQPLHPYSDYSVEYPPGFFLFALPPALLSDSPRAYHALFVGEMGLLLFLALLLCRKLGAALPGPSTSRLLATAATAIWLLGTVVTHRYDAAVALCIVLLSLAVVHERPIGYGAAMALAVLTKGVPLLLVPLWAVYLLSTRSVTASLRALLRAFAMGLVLALPLLFWAGKDALSAVRYHTARPLQIESTWAALLGLFGHLESLHSFWPEPLRVVYTYGSINVLGPGVRALAAFSTLAQVFALFFSYFAFWRRLRAPQYRKSSQNRAEVLHAATLLSLVVYMIFGKVFSPQYLVWLLPLGLWLSLRRGPKALFMLLLVLGMTQIIYPLGYVLVCKQEPWTCVLILLRNGLLLAWALYLFLDLRPRTLPWWRI